MKKALPIKLLLLCAILLGFTSANAQLSFTNASSQIPAVNSGCSVTVTDMNFDGLDDIIRLNQGYILSIEIQNRDGSFTTNLIGTYGSSSAWAMTVADVDHNGWKDVMVDVSGGIDIVMISGTNGNLVGNALALPNAGFFLQNATFCDVNNDGWIDLFCCDDNAASHLYVNDGAGNLQISSMINFAVNPGITYGTDPADSGNYGSCWIDFDNDGDLDLYVAHCRQSSSSPTDLRRINRLFVNNGNNTFTEAAATYGIDIGWQTWTANFGDIDNDGDLDILMTNHDHTSQIFENDGTGHFTELLNTGFNTNSITPIESVFEDFDNDGFNDILVSGSDWVYWKNNGDKTFTQVTGGLFSVTGMLSFATGDLNHDGFVDVYASYGSIYTSPTATADVLYLNNRNSNHFITFDLEGTTSNKNAIGGRATIYGAFGIQVREVRAGESYGTCNSSQLHFGLGANQGIDSVVVRFPSGSETRLYNLQADQFVTVVENTCAISGNIISGPSVICAGQTAALTAAAGFTLYNWSDGEVTNSINATTTGTYNVQVVDATGCSNISSNFVLQQNPDETPTVSSAGDLTFCHGGSVTLSSSVANGYLWSNGDATQSTVVTAGGSYSVTIQGVCGSFTSTPIVVDVLPAPVPIVTGVQANAPASVTLTATGDNLSWYDLQTGGALLTQGPSFTTPILSAPATYWVESSTAYPGAVHTTGMAYHQGTNYSGNTTNGALTFTVTNPCTLASVKVYTDSAGVREIQLQDASNVVLQTVQANIPLDTSRVTLNFALTPGTYKITTNATLNTTNFGYNSPRLQRSSAGVTYPYSVSSLISITGSNQGNNFYYYFYDWQVEEPSFFCTSERVPVVADILNGVADLNKNSGISIYPNPAHAFLNIESNTNEALSVSLIDNTGRLVKEEAFSTQVNKLQINDLAAGVYQVRVTRGQNAYQYKLVVN